MAAIQHNYQHCTGDYSVIRKKVCAATISQAEQQTLKLQIVFTFVCVQVKRTKYNGPYLNNL